MHRVDTCSCVMCNIFLTKKAVDILDVLCVYVVALASNLDSATLSAMASAIRTSSCKHVVDTMHRLVVFDPSRLTMYTGSDANPNIKDVIVTNSVPLKDFRTINQGKTCLDSNAREPDINECKRYASETDGLNFEATPVSFTETSGCIIFQSKVYFQPNDEPNQKCFKNAKCVCVSGEWDLGNVYMRVVTSA